MSDYERGVAAVRQARMSEGSDQWLTLTETLELFLAEQPEVWWCVDAQEDEQPCQDEEDRDERRVLRIGLGHRQCGLARIVVIPVS